IVGGLPSEVWVAAEQTGGGIRVERGVRRQLSRLTITGVNSLRRGGGLLARDLEHRRNRASLPIRVVVRPARFHNQTRTVFKVPRAFWNNRKFGERACVVRAKEE